MLVKTAKLWSWWRHIVFPNFPLFTANIDKCVCIIQRELSSLHRNHGNTSTPPPPLITQLQGRFTLRDLRSSIIITWQRSAILICQGLYGGSTGWTSICVISLKQSHFFIGTVFNPKTVTLWFLFFMYHIRYFSGIGPPIFIAAAPLVQSSNKIYHGFLSTP